MPNLIAQPSLIYKLFVDDVEASFTNLEDLQEYVNENRNYLTYLRDTYKIDLKVVKVETSEMLVDEGFL